MQKRLTHSLEPLCGLLYPSHLVKLQYLILFFVTFNEDLFMLSFKILKYLNLIWIWLIIRNVRFNSQLNHLDSFGIVINLINNLVGRQKDDTPPTSLFAHLLIRKEGNWFDRILIIWLPSVDSSVTTIYWRVSCIGFVWIFIKTITNIMFLKKQKNRLNPRILKPKSSWIPSRVLKDKNYTEKSDAPE